MRVACKQTLTKQRKWIRQTTKWKNEVFKIFNLLYYIKISTILALIWYVFIFESADEFVLYWFYLVLTWFEVGAGGGAGGAGFGLDIIWDQGLAQRAPLHLASFYLVGMK